MFSLESVGIPKNFSNADSEIIKEFEKNISMENDRYDVVLPWKKELIDKVESNFEIAKAIAVNVARRNDKEGYLKDYLNIFEEFEQLGIIESLNFNDIDEKEHVWIPHRPVIKEDPLVKTTKIRPVFNCSLKNGGAPSLNEAAFPGVDLLNPMLGLLVHFRTNDYVMLADLRKAFLNIYLSSDSDRRKFSFVTHDGFKFKYYQFNTILFGFTASPFILNFVLKHHSNLVNNKDLQEVLSQKFYVDNMIVTSNDCSKLSDLAGEIEASLSSVGIKMQEWVTNDKKLASETNAELIETKLLGYKYVPFLDTLEFKNRNLDRSAHTKRKIMSSAASIFDPLGLLNPLFLNTKLFIRKLHQNKLSYDEKLCSDLKCEWEDVCDKFNSSKQLSFPRQTFCDGVLDLVVFCDASKEAYGTAIYAVQNEKSDLIFSKQKLAPNPSKTLPTLELLAVYLGFCNVQTLVEDINFGGTVNKVTFVTDSQVALSWLIKGKALKRNIFVNNRFQDINGIKTTFCNNGMNVVFKFVPSAANMADRVTRTVNFNKFAEDWYSWLSGPEWLIKDHEAWPTGNLGAMPQNGRLLKLYGRK